MIPADTPVGTEVVCIQTIIPLFINKGIIQLVVGHVYTIREMVLGTSLGNKNEVGVYLQEIKNPCSPSRLEWLYSRKAFRRLDLAGLDELLKVDVPIKELISDEKVGFK